LRVAGADRLAVASEDENMVFLEVREKLVQVREGQAAAGEVGALRG